jgi:hypothetical protein
MLWTLRFKDTNGEQHTMERRQMNTLGMDNGDTVAIWYDPQNPNTICSEREYREIMR